MPIYRVTYQSMTACYGPSFISADSEYEARKIFQGTAFSKDEFGLIKARLVSDKELRRALKDQNT